MAILERIQLLCKEKNINPSRLEEELGFGNGTIYKWDKSSPNTDKLAKVADYFDVSLDYLHGRTDIRKPTIDSDIERIIASLPRKGTEELRAIVSWLANKYQK